MKQACLIEPTRRGYFRITQRGLDVLKKAPKKDMAFYILQLNELLSDTNLEERTPLTKFKIGRYNYNVEQDLDNASTLEIIFGSSDGRLYCLDHLGNEEWNFTSFTIIYYNSCLVARNL